jgi:hypothetical protein
MQVEIAYIDLDSGEHISLAKLPYWKRMYRLAYDPSDGHLYGSHYNRFYKINPNTGETIDLDRFSGHSSPKDIWRGDLAYKDGALYLVTNTKIFKIDKNTSVLSELATHNLQNITGAIFDKDDNLILSQLRVSDYGSFNKSKLHNVSLITGDTCKIMDVPAEISDLAYINPKLAPPQQRSAFADESFLNCSTEPLCQPTQLPAISLQAVTDTVTEGGILAFQVILDNPFPADVEVKLSINYETTETDDIIFTYTDNIIIKKEETSFDVEIETVDNDDYQGTRTFILKALAVNNALGDVEAVATINDDENNIPKFNCNGKNQLGVYAGTNTAQGMLIIDCSANHPKPRIYPHASMCSTAKGATLKWESSAKGKREKFTKGWVEIEQDELDTLMSVSYECANQPHSDCPHGTTFGRILDSRLVTSISINNNNVPSCNINYDAKYCIGDGNKTESKSYNLSQCNR